MRLLLDEHLSPAIAYDLRARGHDVEAVAARQELLGLSDALIFDAAGRERRAVVTVDVRGFRGRFAQAAGREAAAFGVILVPAGRFSLRREAAAAVVIALDRLLRELPGDHDLAARGGEHWLQPATGPG